MSVIGPLESLEKKLEALLDGRVNEVHDWTEKQLEIAKVKIEAAVLAKISELLKGESDNLLKSLDK